MTQRVIVVFVELMAVLLMMAATFRSRYVLSLAVRFGVLCGLAGFFLSYLRGSRDPTAIFLWRITKPAILIFTPNILIAERYMPWVVGVTIGLFLIYVWFYRAVYPRVAKFMQKRLRRRIDGEGAGLPVRVPVKIEDFVNPAASGGHDRYFIGIGQDGLPVYINGSDLTRHVQVAGPSGEGKTAGVIFPFMVQGLLKGHSCVVVDGKGDLGLLGNLQAYFCGSSRFKEFLFFTPLRPELSHTYNPLSSSTDPAELTDLLAVGLDLNVPGPGRVYSDTQKAFLLQLFSLFVSTGKRFNFEDMIMFINHADVRDYVYKLSKPELVDSMKHFLGRLKRNFPELLGLVTVIDKLFVSDPYMSGILNSYSSDIDMRDVLEGKRFCLFSFSAGKKAETNEALAKMVLADIANTVGERHGKVKNDFAAIILDEFGQFAPQSFDKFVSTARSANIGIVMSHQTNAQLIDSTGNDRLAVIVRENTATKILFRQSEEADFWSKVFGTKTVVKRTDQLESGRFLTERYSSTGSLREVEEFQIHPNFLKRLQVGQAAFRTKDDASQIISMGMFQLENQEELNLNPVHKPPVDGLGLKEIHRRQLGLVKPGVTASDKEEDMTEELVSTGGETEPTVVVIPLAKNKTATGKVKL